MPPSGSFLDDWLAKQRAVAPPPPLSSTQGLPSARAPQSSPPIPPSPQPDGQIPGDVQSSGNISSDQLDQREISGIAQELKKDLRVDEYMDAGHSAPEDVHSEGVLHLQSQKGKEQSADDTIVIDSEGRLQARKPAPDVVPNE